jgi:hypothetical protein
MALREKAGGLTAIISGAEAKKLGLVKTTNAGERTFPSRSNSITDRRSL